MAKDDLQSALDALNKRFGEGTIVNASKAPKWEGDVISSGSLGLNAALGVGGFPRGRTSVLWGYNMAGKTTLCQHVVAEAQKMGLTAAYVDVEYALDSDYARRCGVDWDKLLLSQPNSGEEAIEVVEGLARSGKVHLIIVDSVAKLIPRAEIEGDVGDATMGGQARLMSQAMRKLGPVIGKNAVCVLYTNQVRHKITAYGNPEYMPGGFALGFEASVIVKLKKINKNTDDKKSQIEAYVTKNKVSAPFRKAYFEIDYLRGIDKISDVATYAIQRDIIDKKGGGNLYFGDGHWRGFDALTEAMRADEQLTHQIAEAVRE